jgi:hypothetical protein
MVRWYEVIPGHDELHKLLAFTNTCEECIRPSAGQGRVCISYKEIMSINPGVFEIYTACFWIHLCYPCISICIYIVGLRSYMPYYDVANLGTVTDQYEWWNAFWLWNCKNLWCENTAPSFPQSLCRGLICYWELPRTCAEVLAAPKFHSLNSQISSHTECTSITAGVFRSTRECSCRVWKHLAKLQGGLGASGRTWNHWWGLSEGLGGLRLGSGLNYILLIYSFLNLLVHSHLPCKVWLKASPEYASHYVLENMAKYTS